MKITLYFIGWNDSFYLPFINKHYGHFCQRIVYYDNYSTDGSQDLAKSLGFEVRTFGTIGSLNDHDYINVKNNCWKEERDTADYVIVCDADEFLVIDRLKGTSLLVKGYNMISEHLPKNDIFEINTGSESESYSKEVIFSPKYIEEINFTHGCHKNNKVGTILNTGCARLFHFRQIGGVQRLIDRHLIYKARMSSFNLKYNMGHHYLHQEQSKREEWNLLTKSARLLF